MKLDDLYQEIILDHYRTKHHSGLREPYDVEVHHVNPSCGDEVRLRLRLTGDVIDDVSYEAVGCSISQASTSVMTDLVIGRPVAEGLALHEEFLALMQSQGSVEPDEERLEDAVAFAGVARFPARVKCALLGWSAFKDAAIRASSVDARTGNGQRPGDEGS
jgi:nitrogen fixation NifU-like protein